MFYVVTAAWLLFTIGSLWLSRNVIAGAHGEGWAYLFSLLALLYLAALPVAFYLLDRHRR